MDLVKIINLVFLKYILRPPRSLIFAICSTIILRFSTQFVSITVSSVYLILLIGIQFRLMPAVSSLIDSRNKVSERRLNRSGDKTHTYLTPLFILIGFDCSLATLTLDLRFL